MLRNHRQKTAPARACTRVFPSGLACSRRQHGKTRVRILLSWPYGNSDGLPAGPTSLPVGHYSVQTCAAVQAVQNHRSAHSLMCLEIYMIYQGSLCPLFDSAVHGCEVGDSLGADTAVPGRARIIVLSTQECPPRRAQGSRLGGGVEGVGSAISATAPGMNQAAAGGRTSLPDIGQILPRIVGDKGVLSSPIRV